MKEIRYHNMKSQAVKSVESILEIPSTEKRILAICMRCYKTFRGERDRGSELAHMSFCCKGQGELDFVWAIEKPRFEPGWWEEAEIVEAAKRGTLPLLPGGPIEP